VEQSLPTSRHPIFRTSWWSSNLLLALAFIALLYSCGWEYSVRHYLKGFSDAIVPAGYTQEQKIEAILDWMRTGPPRAVAANLEELSARDPVTTLNYQQLLAVCGTATNAFLNVSRSAGLSVRRLLLLTPDRNTKHVVAEVLVGQRWIIVDPTYRVILRDAQGHYLTRRDLQNPMVFAEAASAIPNYPREYSFDHFAHVRLARLPLEGIHLRRALDLVYPGWDESIDWSLILERESFFYLLTSAAAFSFFLLMRTLLGWYADRRLRIPRFHLREHVVRAGAAFVFTPEIKE
jgi:hypothetical protein